MGTLTVGLSSSSPSNQITGFTLATPVAMSANVPTSTGICNAITYSLDGTNYFPWPILESANQTNLNGSIISYAIYDTIKFNTTLNFKIVMWPSTWPFNLIGAAILQQLTPNSSFNKKGVSMVSYIGSKTYGKRFCLPLLPGLQLHSKAKYL